MEPKVIEIEDETTAIQDKEEVQPSVKTSSLQKPNSVNPDEVNPKLVNYDNLTLFLGAKKVP